jgi:hypothetical protein
MLKICSKVLLISSVASFVEYITELAQDAGVKIEVADEWNPSYRLDADVIMCGSKFLSQINVLDYDKVRLLLKTNETVAMFLDMGITHFIFDYNNIREVAFSFFVEEKSKSLAEFSVEDTLYVAHKDSFVTDKYNFNFRKNVFKYKEVGIYLTEGEKVYLAKWLFLGKKENDKRILLCKMRKKFGKDFLKDINRYGQVKGEKE